MKAPTWVIILISQRSGAFRDTPLALGTGVEVRIIEVERYMVEAKDVGGVRGSGGGAGAEGGKLLDVPGFGGASIPGGFVGWDGESEAEGKGEEREEGERGKERHD